MPRTDTIVIGGGPAGLAVSRCLGDAGRDHVVLERGRLAESWRSQRWDSLRLLTPNWMNRLPGWSDTEPDPDGFLPAADLVSVLERYALASRAPVLEGTTVTSVRHHERGWTVTTDQGTWRSANVVVATGHCMRLTVPEMAATLDHRVHQLGADRYRNPAQLPDGGVLVVGASSTGLQLAEELAAHGRDVVLSVGRHTRLPRRYRGHDIFRWLDRLGVLDDRVDEHPDPRHVARSPSMQLVGSEQHRQLDLGTARAAGVELAGRLVAIDGHRATFAPTIEQHVASADARLHRMLDRIDSHVWGNGLEAHVGAPDRPTPMSIGPTSDAIDLRERGITTVLWATGYRREYPWLPAVALDGHGEIRQRHGVGAMPGLYVVGLRFQRRRRSGFIGGLHDDARVVANHLTGRPVLDEEHAA